MCLCVWLLAISLLQEVWDYAPFARLLLQNDRFLAEMKSAGTDHSHSNPLSHLLTPPDSPDGPLSS